MLSLLLLTFTRLDPRPVESPRPRRVDDPQLERAALAASAAAGIRQDGISINAARVNQRALADVSAMAEDGEEVLAVRHG